MARMEMRTREAPMEWEREQDRNLPNIFSNPQPLADQTTTPTTSNGQQQKPFGFGASVQRGSSFASNQGSFTSDGCDATTPKPFRQDSQLSAGTATFSRQDSFSFGSGGGSFSRPQSPNNTAPQSFTGASSATMHRDGSATTEVMEVDEYPSTRNAKTGGNELFDMGSLRNGVVAEQQGLSPRRMLGKTRSSSSSAMVGSRTSSMQYRGSGGTGRGSKFWSDGDDEDNDEDMNELEDNSEEENYGRRGSGRQSNRHMTRNMDIGRREGDQDGSERRSDHVRSPVPQGRVWSENVDLPYILSGYVQVMMNLAFVGIVIYIIYNFITTIQSDVSIRAEVALLQEQKIINDCKWGYDSNFCHKPRGPYLEPMCQKLKDCFSKPLPKIERYAV
ncbi:hypothetical protein EC957_009841 [Mortierella hygrophila]|uniref:Brl1/Brr6 domain-containing protein n=1 Tax=Mortierella hygrophila TaxID=979708 RepID=A0A9P6FAN0_9FUNG|nr:hypothetical protein EC957_009841 [Mortierella hygrophila]